MSRKTVEICLVALGMLVLAIISTYPLIRYFDYAIPYAAFGGPLGWNRTGDMLQLLYWFWLVKENFTGAVPFDSNPYEFNMLMAPDSSGLNSIPLAFLYMLFSPLGDAAAYNCTILSSYVLAGVFMYLLARLYSGSRLGALFAAVIFTFAPSRIHGVASGHGYGFLFFLYPFVLYYLETAIRSQKIRYGLLAGIGLICLAMLEPHLIYYLCVFLAVFIPVRLVAQLPAQATLSTFPATIGKTLDSWSLSRSLLIIWGSALAAVFYTQVLFVCRDQDPFFTPFSGWVFGLYPFIVVLLAMSLAAIYERTSPLNFRQGLAVAAGSLMPLYSLLLLAGWTCVYRPVSTAIVVAALLALVLTVKLILLRHHLVSIGRTLGQGLVLTKKSVLAVIPLILSMGLIVVWIMASKVSQVSSTIVGGGRTLRDVELFTSRIPDLFTSTSYVFLGLIPALLILYLFIRIIYLIALAGDQEKLDTEAQMMRLFYISVAFCSYVLAMGVAFGKSSLYIFFYHYFPFFNYPRVSDRIMTMVLFAGAITVAFAVKSIQERWTRPAVHNFMILLLVIAMGVQLKDYNVFKPMGITLLDQGQDIYNHVQENIDDGLLLEIPLWPGDSHQSSLYQHYIMIDRVKRVNGYSPLVLNEYIKNIFEPLNSINSGMINRQQYDMLHRLKVKFITVHDHENVFPKKVSTYGPITTVRRLRQSPYLEFVDMKNVMHFKTFDWPNQDLYLFKVKDHVPAEVENEVADWYGMPYFYGVNSRLHQETGQIVEDKEIDRQVFGATEGKHKPGFLIYGPYDLYSPGNYRCYFTIQTEGKSDEDIARLEVASVIDNGDQVVLAQAGVKSGQGDKLYRKMYLDFTIAEKAKMEFRVYYYGKGHVRLEQIAVYPADHDVPLNFLDAAKMVGDTGQLMQEKDTSTGKVVAAIVGGSKPGKMVYGPNRTYGKGQYSARFYLRTQGVEQVNKAEIAAALSVTDEHDLIIFSQQDIAVSELNDNSFTGVDVEFVLTRDEELSFQVEFTGKASLQLDGIEIIRH